MIIPSIILASSIAVATISGALMTAVTPELTFQETCAAHHRMVDIFNTTTGESCIRGVYHTGGAVRFESFQLN